MGREELSPPPSGSTGRGKIGRRKQRGRELRENREGEKKNEEPRFFFHFLERFAMRNLPNAPQSCCSSRGQAPLRTHAAAAVTRPCAHLRAAGRQPRPAVVVVSAQDVQRRRRRRVDAASSSSSSNQVSSAEKLSAELEQLAAADDDKSDPDDDIGVQLAKLRAQVRGGEKVFSFERMPLALLLSCSPTSERVSFSLSTTLNRPPTSSPSSTTPTPPPSAASRTRKTRKRRKKEETRTRRRKRSSCSPPASPRPTFSRSAAKTRPRPAPCSLPRPKRKKVLLLLLCPGRRSRPRLHP